MHQKKLIWKLLPPLLLIFVTALLIVMANSARTMRGFHITEKENELHRLAKLLGSNIREMILDGDIEGLIAESQVISEKFQARITLVAPDGAVLVDTHEYVSKMDNHRNRPEILEADSAESGRAVRYSKTLGAEMLYVAVPARARPIDESNNDDSRLGYIRVAMPLSAINEALRSMYFRLIFGTIAAAFLTGVFCYLVARRITHPLHRLKAGAQRFATGRFDQKIEHSDIREMNEVASAMNSMAAELDTRIRTVRQQKNELDAILSSMDEGVIAVNSSQKVISINQTAISLLNIKRRIIIGRPLQEVIRHSELKEIVESALSDRQPAKGEIVTRANISKERYLQVSASALKDSQGGCFGAVIVLSDQTQVKRLERIRSDFVANVSHELRTPITSIKGFVETLQQEDLDLPGDKRKFLDIIARQANRMTEIIRDLLTLSAIEKDAGSDWIELRLCPLDGVLENVLRSCRHKAEGAEIKLEMECTPELEARINPELFEQALINLVDNAIKYSSPHGTVRIETEKDDQETVVRVIDHGCGIAREHLDRVFERFYRVDKARSRKLGGTGLGLAIVKHIAIAHGGCTEVESTPGKGSIFSIHLPS